MSYSTVDLGGSRLSKSLPQGIPPSLLVLRDMGVQPLWARLGISRIPPKMEFAGGVPG